MTVGDPARGGAGTPSGGLKRSRRGFAAVLLAGMVLAMGALVWVARLPEPARAADSPMLDHRVVRAIPPTTLLEPEEPQVAAYTRPVNVPRDPYAAEPIRVIGTIEIPKIGLRHQLYHGISLRNIDRGPSHWPGTALPGETGNTVVAGHRVTHSHPFRNIHQLVKGDQVIFTIDADDGAHRSTYVVTGSEIVGPTALHIVNQTSTPTGTLFACHPPGSARQRYVVHLALLAE